MKCPVCGKQFYTTYPDNWPFKEGETLYCSKDCMLVFAPRAKRVEAKEPLIADHAVRKIWKKMRYSSRK